MKTLFAPGMTYRSFIAIISIVEVIVFIATVLLTPIEGYTLKTSAFLGPSSNVYSGLNKNPNEIKCNFQIWRLVTPIFLHAGFGHII